MRLLAHYSVGNDIVMVVSHRRWWRRSTVAWRGSGTVWHRADNGDRAPASVERWLADRWAYINYAD